MTSHEQMGDDPEAQWNEMKRSLKASAIQPSKRIKQSNESLVSSNGTAQQEAYAGSESLPPLLRIPSEIRREIVRYLLPNPTKRFRLYTDSDSTVVGGRWNRESTHRPDPLNLAIFRINRIIYLEALSVLYSENLFHFIGFSYLPVLEFIRRLGPDARDMVRKVRLTLLTDKQGQQQPPANHDNFCTVIHDFFPGLTSLHADPWVWI